MKPTVCKRLVLLLVLMAILLCAGCSKAPDYTGFSDTATLLSVLQLAEKDLLPEGASPLTFRAANPGKDSTYHLTFAPADRSEEAFDRWSAGLRDKTKALDMDGDCRVVHNTGGAKDAEPHNSRDCWYIAYSAEQSVKYLAYRTESGEFALKIQFSW